MEQQIAMLLQQVMEVSDRLRQNEESSEQVKTIAGSPQDSWADAGGANESDGRECERYVSGWWQSVRPGRKRHLELTMDDSDLERLRRDTNQRN